MRKISTAIVALATLALAAPASAAEILFTGWTGTTSGGQTFTDGDVNVRVSAWSVDPDGIIHTAPLSGWSGGLYIRNGWNDSSHTVDNGGWNEFLLFQFDQSLELHDAEFNTGWWDSDWNYINDTDATIGYGTVDLNALPYTSQPPLNGWQWSSFASFANPYGSDSSVWGDDTRDINPVGNAGNFWLIGASFDDRYDNDGFKLKNLQYSVVPPPPPAVPEPATWLTMILGFGLVGGAMRREKRKGAAALA